MTEIFKPQASHPTQLSQYPVSKPHSRVRSPFDGTKSFLKPTDIAVLLGVPLPKVYLLIRTGQITAFRLGRVLRVEAKDLSQFIHGQKQRGTR